MKIAVMQPYFFPYIGYFQLIDAVDKFIIYDDVNYINRGWINRNNLLVGGKSFLFTLPLREASQNKKIHEIAITQDRKVIDKLLKTVAANYKKASYFEPVYELVGQIFNNSATSIAGFNLVQLKSICRYIGIDTQIEESSTFYNNAHLKGEERIVDICARESASVYINPIGGVELYNRNLFEEKGVELCFLKTTMIEYAQFTNPFVPWLSIIDVLMFNNIDQIRKMLKQFQLI
jgi:hypothetical protein